MKNLFAFVFSYKNTEICDPIRSSCGCRTEEAQILLDSGKNINCNTVDDVAKQVVTHLQDKKFYPVCYAYSGSQEDT